MNGLKLIKLVSQCKIGLAELKDWDQLQQFIGSYLTEGMMVAYLNYKVLFGRIAANKVAFYENEQFDPRYLLELRVFNENCELRLQRRDEKFFWRWRDDKDGEPWEAVEAEQLLWGKLSDTGSAGWNRLEEERGFSLVVPFSGGETGQRLVIRTRNYIKDNQLGQMGYVDSRLVGLKEVR